jgi:hypothetical protein
VAAVLGVGHLYFGVRRLEGRGGKKTEKMVAFDFLLS